MMYFFVALDNICKYDTIFFSIVKKNC